MGKGARLCFRASPATTHQSNTRTQTYAGVRRGGCAHFHAGGRGGLGGGTRAAAAEQLFQLVTSVAHGVAELEPPHREQDANDSNDDDRCRDRASVVLLAAAARTAEAGGDIAAIRALGCRGALRADGLALLSVAGDGARVEWGSGVVDLSLKQRVDGGGREVVA